MSGYRRVGWRPRRADGGRADDAGTAMLLVVMCLLVAMTLSTALLGIVLGETVPTAHQAKSARTLRAAEAGLQTAIGGLRAAYAADGTGDVTKLPCWSSAAPLTGTVGSGRDALTLIMYTVTVAYYSIDPSGQSANWRAAGALPCTPGSGPAGLPLYALILSSATGPSGAGMSPALGNRSLELVYELSTTDAGTLGGQIHTDVAAGFPDLCWTAPSASPGAGQTLTLGSCVPGDPRQQFAYRSDYSLVLAGTQSTTAPGTGGLCVTKNTVLVGTLFQDSMSWGNMLTPRSGGITAGGPGPLSGPATTFDGSGYLDASKAEPSTPGALSVSAWFRTTTAGTIVSYTPHAHRTVGDTAVVVDVDSAGTVSLKDFAGGAMYSTDLPVGALDGQWHHVVATIGPAGSSTSSDRLALTVDGSAGSVDISSSQAGRFAGYWHLGWGRSTWGAQTLPAPGSLTGSLAHVAVWNAQLTSDQAAMLRSQTTTSALASAISALDARSYWPLTGTASSSTTLDFQPCDGGNGQKWSYNAIMSFQGLEDDGSALADECISGASQQTVGTTLVVVPCASWQQWVPDKTVGAGAAGPAMQQLVNYDQYGRCLDVTYTNVNSEWLIAYPCKQDPSSPVEWNQRWVWDGSGTRQLQTVPWGTAYCLTTAGSEGGLVTVTVCSSAREDQRWMVNGDTGNRSTSYTIVDSSGRCLDLGPVQGTGSVSTWSSIVTDTCRGTYAQKWNAPPTVGNGGVLRQRETTTEWPPDTP